MSPIDVSCGIDPSALNKEKEKGEKPKFVQYSQRFTYDLGLLAAVEHAGGFEHLYQQIYDYIYRMNHSNQVHDTVEEPDNNTRQVPQTSSNRDGLHRTSGTEASHRRSDTIRDTRPFSFHPRFHTAPRTASTSGTAQRHSLPHSPPALAAIMSDGLHPTHPSIPGTAAEWSFVEPPPPSPTYAGSQLSGGRAEDTHETHSWLAPARGSAPQSPYFPVLTRRWMGSAVGREGDAIWSRGFSSTVDNREVRKDLRGGLGLAHEGREYGRE